MNLQKPVFTGSQVEFQLNLFCHKRLRNVFYEFFGSMAKFQVGVRVDTLETLYQRIALIDKALVESTLKKVLLVDR